MAMAMLDIRLKSGPPPGQPSVPSLSVPQESHRQAELATPNAVHVKCQYIIHHTLYVTLCLSGLGWKRLNISKTHVTIHKVNQTLKKTLIWSECMSYKLDTHQTLIVVDVKYQFIKDGTWWIMNNNEWWIINCRILIWSETHVIQTRHSPDANGLILQNSQKACNDHNHRVNILQNIWSTWDDKKLTGGHALTSGRTSFANLKTSQSFPHWTWKSDFNERVQQRTERAWANFDIKSYVKRALRKC